MMAARAMGCPRTEAMITACESYLPMVNLMRKVLHLNGMGRNINVINKRSDELNFGVDISSRADVLVSTTLGFASCFTFRVCTAIYIYILGDKILPHFHTDRSGV